jgi:CRP/FNR family cyclic AMP-dependent transcriptional regulator
MAETRKEIEEGLGRSFLFPLLNPSERERFIAAAHPRSWPAGATIFVLDDPGTSMMLVRTGTVRIGYPTPEGRTFLLAELGPGSVFGEIALLDGGPRSADATAATDCTLWAFERRDFLPLLEHNWKLAEAVLRVVCGRLRSADAHIADLAFSDLPGRLAKTLIARAQPGPRGAPPRVSDTQGALAAMVGGSREAVNRCLKKWEGEGMI